MAKKKDEESEIMSSSSSEEEAEKKKKKHKKRETSSSEEESSEEEKKSKLGKKKDSSEETISSSDRKSKEKNKRKTSSSDSSSESSESSSSNDNKRKGGNKPSTSRQFKDYEKLKEDLCAKFERIFQAKNDSFEATKKCEMEELRRQKENFNKELAALQKERESVAKLRLELEEQRLKNDKTPVALGTEEVNKKKKKHKKWGKFSSSSEEESSEEEKNSKRGKKKDSSEESSSSSDEYGSSDEEDAVEIINNFLPQEVNIVLFGGTGVGKSTFINSIANMLSHSTLEDAMMDLHVLIRTSFHHISDNHEQRQIVMEPTIQVERQGEADNESDKVGESCTKYPRSYVFKYGRKNERTLRIIDTPGVGDARGVEQDRENFRHIINFISSFREIHAFLFLMKPNDSRLELQFRYCISELLTHLHVSATNNIIFTFTNGRGTNYKPSETFGILQALLNSVKEESGVDIQLKDRCVVFDNESYRYLCECQYGIKHKDWEVENYKKSWTYGKKELAKMLEIIAGFEPHDVTTR